MKYSLYVDIDSGSILVRPFVNGDTAENFFMTGYAEDSFKILQAAVGFVSEFKYAGFDICSIVLCSSLGGWSARAILESLDAAFKETHLAAYSILESDSKLVSHIPYGISISYCVAEMDSDNQVYVLSQKSLTNIADEIYVLSTLQRLAESGRSTIHPSSVGIKVDLAIETSSTKKGLKGISSEEVILSLVGDESKKFKAYIPEITRNGGNLSGPIVIKDIYNSHNKTQCPYKQVISAILEYVSEPPKVE